MKTLHRTEIQLPLTLTDFAKHELLNTLKDNLSVKGKYLNFFSLESKGQFIIVPRIKELNLVIKSNYILPKSIVNEIKLCTNGFLSAYKALTSI